MAGPDPWVKYKEAKDAEAERLDLSKFLYLTYIISAAFDWRKPVDDEPATTGARAPAVSAHSFLDFFTSDHVLVGSYMFDGDPFAVFGGVRSPITGFTILDETGAQIVSFGNLRLIDPDDFAAMFMDLSRSSSAVFDDVIALTDGGCTGIGSRGNDTFDMGSGRNTVTGGAGDDTLHKSDRGNVQFDGGAGTDTLSFVGQGSQAFPHDFIQTMVVNLANGRGLNPYGGKLHLSGVENVVGTDSADIITGSNKANVIGDGFQDGGADTIKARGGDDIVKAVDLDLIRSNGGRGFDTFQFLGNIDLQDADFAARVTNFEKYEVFNFFILPPGSSLKGDAGDNWFQCDDGQDTLEGRGGNDILDGGNALKNDFSPGVDVAVWSGNRGRYSIKAEGGTLTVTDKRPGSPDGRDTVVNIETLRFNDKDLSVAVVFPQLGNGYFGTSGNDGLGGPFGTTKNLSAYGLGGDDILTGGAGDDLLVGGTGNDTYVLSDGRDKIVELAGEGTDTIEIPTFSALTGFSLAKFRAIENLTNNDFHAMRLTGNSLNNVITSFNGADTLRGGGGDDTLIGWNGQDVLTGGKGRDVFVFTSTLQSTIAQPDTITDFNSPNADRIDLSGIDAIVGGDDDAFDFIGGAAFSAQGQVRVYQSGGMTIVEANSQGDLAADLRIELVGPISLGEHDFLL